MSAEFPGMGIAEKEALVLLASHLLKLEWPPPDEALSRLSLLWLDWAMADEPSAAAPSPPDVPMVTTPEEASEPEHRFDPRVESAIEAISLAPSRYQLVGFLRQLAEINGLSDEESVFLGRLQRAMDPGRGGPYR